MEKEIVTVNHWGKWVTSDVPVPGILSANSLAWEFMDDLTCLTCEAMYKEVEEMEHCPNCGEILEEDYCPKSGCEWSREDEYDYIECDSSHEKIFGDAWVLDTKTGKWMVSENKEGLEFAAALLEFDVVVEWSKYVGTEKVLCSPCAAGCASIDSKGGDFCCYTLPEYLIYKDEE